MKMPASFAEFSDALQKARIKDGSFCKNELTCIHYNGLTHAMIGWNANLYDLNLFAQRLASLTEEQKKGMDALLKIKQNHRVAPIPLNQLINLTYNTDICCFAPRVSNHEELGAFLYANEMLSNEAMALLDTTEEGSGFQERLLELLGEQHQEDHGGVFTDFGYAELGGEIKDIYVCQSNETACFHRSDAPVMLEVRKGFFNDPSYTVSNVYYPDGDSQLAWVRWTTPDEPQDMTIDVDVSGPGSAQATIHCKIVDLDENPPPNPVADDRNDSFTPSPVPDRPEKTSAQWTIWDPWWQEYWVWHGDDEDGYWCDHGWWEFDLDRYSASLSAAMEITPDEKNPTASDSTMKSGYGVNQVVTARVNSSQRSATTALQNAVSYFPEFNYESFWRLLDRISISSSSSRLEFQKNEYSTYNRRTHFTPIWYPDGSYTVNTWVIDCWTPAGMLSVNLTDSLNIRGNLWDDWHIAPLDL